MKSKHRQASGTKTGVSQISDTVQVFLFTIKSMEAAFLSSVFKLTTPMMLSKRTSYTGMRLNLGKSSLSLLAPK